MSATPDFSFILIRAIQKFIVVLDSLHVSSDQITDSFKLIYCLNLKILNVQKTILQEDKIQNRCLCKFCVLYLNIFCVFSSIFVHKIWTVQSKTFTIFLLYKCIFSWIYVKTAFTRLKNHNDMSIYKLLILQYSHPKAVQ